mmetsp:Transcript_8151/g.17715  ORF Transcript_8151/g.17715 Transcript_8151/m.17715 type:complete len:269 (-) Transcript_8151:140-946(-)
MRSEKKIVYSADIKGSSLRGSEEYQSVAVGWHREANKLLGGMKCSYRTSILRCNSIEQGRAMIRWRAEWIPGGIEWIVSLSEVAGWSIQYIDQDPRTLSTFRWGGVRDLIARAVTQGNITIPCASVEGTAYLEIDSESGKCTRHKERIDTISEADGNRLLNRKVARNTAEFLDIRRPPNVDPDEWAGIVESRVLSGVPGAGALDIEPMDQTESDSGAFFLVISLVLSVAVTFLVGFLDQSEGSEIRICEQVSALGDFSYEQCLADIYK